MAKKAHDGLLTSCLSLVTDNTSAHGPPESISIAVKNSILSGYSEMKEKQALSGVGNAGIYVWMPHESNGFDSDGSLSS
jgi:hypothetical protein